MADPESTARASLFRSLIIYAAMLALDLLAVWYIAANGESGGAYITISIVGLVGLLLAHQVWQHVRDLQSPLSESEGPIVRKWQRADLVIVWQSYYIQIDRTIFRVAPRDYVMVDEAMYVKVVHFPRTLNVVSVHEMKVSRLSPSPGPPRALP